jgi:hypothetical protein
MGHGLWAWYDVYSQEQLMLREIRAREKEEYLKAKLLGEQMSGGMPAD